MKIGKFCLLHRWGLTDAVLTKHEHWDLDPNLGSEHFTVTSIFRCDRCHKVKESVGRKYAHYSAARVVKKDLLDSRQQEE